AVGVVVERDQPDLVSPGLGIVASPALIGNVTHHMAVLVLGPRFTQVHTDAPVHHRQIIVRVAAGIQGVDANKASTVDQLCFDLGDLVRKSLKRKRLAVYVEQIARYRFGMCQGSVELSMIRVGQLDSPPRGIGDICRAPIHMRLENSGLEWHRLYSLSGIARGSGG